MGGGSYSMIGRSARTEEYNNQSFEETFTAKSLKNDMDPKGIQHREARDSTEHPNSLPIIIALDVTGSMGSVPDHIVKDALPKFIDKLIQAGIPDPQVLFLGIGDHTCDDAPLQVGQFESSDELMDKWLTSVYMEKGGGANDAETYILAWYFAANHTKIDSMEKRNQKGFLFTIGDEPTYDLLTERDISEVMGGEALPGQGIAAKTLFDDASKLYEVYHIHTTETRTGRYYKSDGLSHWKELVGQNLLEIESVNELVDLLSKTIINGLGSDVVNTSTENYEPKYR